MFEAINNLKNKATLDTKITVLKIANTPRKFIIKLACVIDKSLRESLFPSRLKLAHAVPGIRKEQKLAYKITDQYLWYHIFLKPTKNESIIES